MSYCRFGEADVYVYAAVGGWLECCFCWLEPASERFATTAAMLAHLAEHRAAGHRVPAYVDAELLEDAAENDAYAVEVAAAEASRLDVTLPTS